jgi:hypothetical protein
MEKANKALSMMSERMIQFSQAGPRQTPPATSGLRPHECGNMEELRAAVHKTRDPLNAIAVFARKLEKKLSPDSDEGRYVRVIVQASSKLESALDALEHKKQVLEA